MIKKFKSKEKVFDYIKKRFGGKVAIIRGSTAVKPVKMFCDFDIEIHGDEFKKPYYEIVFVNNKLSLMSIYFYKYKSGRKINAPKNIKIIYGDYNDKIEPDFSPDTYNHKEKVKRECQMVIDFMFKYLRNQNKKCLESIQRRIQ